MSTFMKDALRKLARTVMDDPTADNDKKKLARGVLALMGERP